MKAFVGFALFVYFGQYVVLADYDDICRLLKDGTKFRCPDSCNKYITCKNQTAEVFSCVTPTMYDRNKYQCVKTASDCQKNYCNGFNGKWVANPSNCHGFFYCAKGVAHPGYCEYGYKFDESKQFCIYDKNSECFLVANLCEFLPDKTKFRDENDCTVYYECSNGKKSKKTCKNNSYFNVEIGACIDKSLVACTAHPLPTNVCGTVNKPSSGFKVDGATCRGYFYCQHLGIVPDLEPQWGQCPEGLFFSAKAQACIEPIYSDCQYNRCDGRGTMFVQAGSNDCRNYIICENGRFVGERTCNGDKFFDEKRQACVTDIITYPSCEGKK